MAKYLAKYLASPPIAVRRIDDYDGQTVSYWYQDHKTKRKKFERVDVLDYIGRMVQHILPKSFQRVRYFGLQATASFRKWAGAIREGIEKIGRAVKGVYQIVKEKKYRERYREIGGCDPFACRFCGKEMELMKIWNPKYGAIFDGLEDKKAVIGELESEESIKKGKKKVSFRQACVT